MSQDRKPVDVPPEAAAGAAVPQRQAIPVEESVTTYPAFSWEWQNIEGPGAEGAKILQIVVPGPYTKVYRFPMDKDSVEKVGKQALAPSIEIAPAGMGVGGFPPEGG